MHHDHYANGACGEAIADLPHQLSGFIFRLVLNLEHAAEILSQTVWCASLQHTPLLSTVWLSTICCLLSTVCWLLSTVRDSVMCLPAPYTMYCLLFACLTVYCSVSDCLLLTVDCRLLTVGCWLLAVDCWLLTVECALHTSKCKYDCTHRQTTQTQCCSLILWK